ncbi:VPLPA-CTERM sorting domain-containing protein [Aliiroseovarius sp. YM-037]|uniref:VPLPA-CTERM sorting domain-containing protein n=1 Tax=Aliiroseovarius sp. YM-037 TaxID=3341728 RepID=UPI003A804890
MFSTFRKALPFLFIALAPAANAATYDINGVLDYSANGFRTSLFHSQTCGRMCGYEVEDPTSATGTWDSVTGALSATMNLLHGGYVSITGNLLMSDRGDSSLGFQGLYTDTPLSFAFSPDSQYGATTMGFSFMDRWHNGEANGLGNGMISLWGDNGNWSQQNCRQQGSECVGVDLRLQVSPAPVPLPGSIGFLMAGMGGFAYLRRKKKAGATA